MSSGCAEDGAEGNIPIPIGADRTCLFSNLPEMDESAFEGRLSKYGEVERIQMNQGGKTEVEFKLASTAMNVIKELHNGCFKTFPGQIMQVRLLKDALIEESAQDDAKSAAASSHSSKASSKSSKGSDDEDDDKTEDMDDDGHADYTEDPDGAEKSVSVSVSMTKEEIIEDSVAVSVSASGYNVETKKEIDPEGDPAAVTSATEATHDTSALGETADGSVDQSEVRKRLPDTALERGPIDHEKVIQEHADNFRMFDNCITEWLESMTLEEQLIHFSKINRCGMLNRYVAIGNIEDEFLSCQKLRKELDWTEKLRPEGTEIVAIELHSISSGKDIAHVTCRDIKAAVYLRSWILQEHKTWKVAHCCPRKASRVIRIGGLPEDDCTGGKPWYQDSLEDLIQACGSIKGRVRYNAQNQCLFVTMEKLSEAVLVRNKLYSFPLQNDAWSPIYYLNVDFAEEDDDEDEEVYAQQQQRRRQTKVKTKEEKIEIIDEEALSVSSESETYLTHPNRKRIRRRLPASLYADTPATMSPMPPPLPVGKAKLAKLKAKAKAKAMALKKKKVRAREESIPSPVPAGKKKKKIIVTKKKAAEMAKAKAKGMLFTMKKKIAPKATKTKTKTKTKAKDGVKVKAVKKILPKKVKVKVKVKDEILKQKPVAPPLPEGTFERVLCTHPGRNDAEGQIVSLYKMGEFCCDAQAEFVEGNEALRHNFTDSIRLDIDQRTKTENLHSHKSRNVGRFALWKLLPNTEKDEGRYDELFRYFVQRDRVGLVQTKASHVYIVPPDKDFLAKLNLPNLGHAYAVQIPVRKKAAPAPASKKAEAAAPAAP